MLWIMSWLQWQFLYAVTCLPLPKCRDGIFFSFLFGGYEIFFSFLFRILEEFRKSSCNCVCFQEIGHSLRMSRPTNCGETFQNFPWNLVVRLTVSNTTWFCISVWQKKKKKKRCTWWLYGKWKRSRLESGGVKKASTDSRDEEFTWVRKCSNDRCCPAVGKWYSDCNNSFIYLHRGGNWISFYEEKKRYDLHATGFLDSMRVL